MSLFFDGLRHSLNGEKLRILEMLHLGSLIRRTRIYFVLPLYLLIFSFSYFLSYALRFDGAIPPWALELFGLTIGLVLAAKVPAFWSMSSFHGWWSHVCFSDLIGLVKATALSTVLLICLDFFLLPLHQIPRSVLVIDCCLTMMLMGGLRSVWRFVREDLPATLRTKSHTRVFVIGAEQGGERLVGELRKWQGAPMRVVGFLDKDASHKGSRLAGVPFLGSTDDVLRLAAKREATGFSSFEPNVLSAVVGRLAGSRRGSNSLVRQAALGHVADRLSSFRSLCIVSDLQ